MNLFNFPDTLDDYSLRYQEPIPRRRGKEVDINYRTQHEMNSVIYIAGNPLQNKSTNFVKCRKLIYCEFLAQNDRIKSILTAELYELTKISKSGLLCSWMTTCLGKSCSFGLPRVPFVNCRQFMYLVISLFVLRAGCGIWLCRFLIIAYLFTFQIPISSLIICSCLLRWSPCWVPVRYYDYILEINLTKRQTV